MALFGGLTSPIVSSSATPIDCGDDPKYLQRVKMLMTFIEQLRHLYTLTKRMAKTQMPAGVTGDAALA